jgi:RNA polymerase sigma-70 factor (ECF subfamily)
MTAQELGGCFDRHAAMLVLYARQWVVAATAEDIVQEVFVRLAARSGVAPSGDAIRPYLLMAVRHAAMDAIRRDRRSGARERAAGAARPLFSQPMDLATDSAEIERALGTLSAREREIVTLRIWGGCTFGEIGAIMGFPVATVHARYQEAIGALKTFWEVPCANR